MHDVSHVPNIPSNNVYLACPSLVTMMPPLDKLPDIAMPRVTDAIMTQSKDTCLTPYFEQLNLNESLMEIEDSTKNAIHNQDSS